MIIIGYEGGKREPKYFQNFERQLLESKVAFIHPLPPLNNESAPNKVLERVKTFVEDSNRGVNIEEGDQVWFVLDKDRFPEKHFVSVNEYCLEADNRHLVISNPCFEVWLWMHLDDAQKIKSDNSSALKEELHQLAVGMKFGGDWHNFVDLAISRAEESDKDTSGIIPQVNRTRLYLLVKELLSFKKD